MVKKKTGFIMFKTKSDAEYINKEYYASKGKVKKMKNGYFIIIGNKKLQYNR
jgi:predicted RNA-binding protein (virulence factor B family)